jgi:hypothetical protein
MAPPFLTLVLDGDEWSDSRRCCCTLGANFRKTSQCQISRKSAQQSSSSYMRTDKERYMTNCRTHYLQLFPANLTEKVNNLWARFIQVYRQNNWISNSTPGRARCDQKALQGI